MAPPAHTPHASDTQAVDDWYKDAVIYQVHVRAFHDSTGDGVGDFVGLTRKLDYIQSLGVSAIWLLPFYPSPLRDDGYDIAHYQDVHASYGTKRDFRTFLDAAHQRGLKVITELVINHTSDQHPWFQAARRARRGTSKRDFYVWSDSPDKYPGVPIVFKDTEPSNWTWDATAGQYFWHRFFHHQPDLNFDNPLVQKAVLKVMRFWLDMGVDGMRLDAVPYLVEREGTECANLAETHDILRAIRADLDARYRGRMLLAEANQWPADVRAYFGNEDECHMAFHFPLMPRLYMALQQEDRHPISEILYQTPEIPESCQWALFLRNHDELTLEMVSDEERDYMYATYATDPQMRLNAGIRRRLAPLLENNRARIELLNSLLLSLPGTPVLYYGDEIGMGDNVYLGDRNGVRTPMQWNADRNGGFSTADPARLYAPPIMDPVFGYQSVNVEAQERAPHSLLNWMRRMIALRRQHDTFGRGTLELLRPLNRAIFAFVRRCATGDPILVVANLSRTVQPVSLDLSHLAGLVPTEMTGGIELPRITDAPYFLTLGPYGFMWLLLTRASAATPVRIDTQPDTDVELPPLLVGPEWGRMLDGSVRQLLERRYLPAFLSRQAWLLPSTPRPPVVSITDWTTLVHGEEPVMVTILSITTPGGPEARYVVPLSIAPGERGEQIRRDTPEAVVARVGGARRGVLHARLDGPVGRALMRVSANTSTIQMMHGRLAGTRLDHFDNLNLPADLDTLRPQPYDFEQFHSAAAFGERVMLFSPRRLWPGVAPAQEIASALHRDGRFTRVPVPVARLDYVADDGVASPAVLLDQFIPHQADGWRQIRGEVDRFLQTVLTLGAAPDAPIDPAKWWSLELPAVATRSMPGSIRTLTLLGRRIGEFHRAVSRLPIGTTTDADAHTAAIIPHGELDLAHVLVHEEDYTLIGMAGRRDQPPDQRLTPQPALSDLASLLISMTLAAQSAAGAGVLGSSPQVDLTRGWLRCWMAWGAASLLAGYRSETVGAPFYPSDPAASAALLRQWFLTRAGEQIRPDAPEVPHHRVILQRLVDELAAE